MYLHTLKLSCVSKAAATKPMSSQRTWPNVAACANLPCIWTINPAHLLLLHRQTQFDMSYLQKTCRLQLPPGLSRSCDTDTEGGRAEDFCPRPAATTIRALPSKLSRSLQAAQTLPAPARPLVPESRTRKASSHPSSRGLRKQKKCRASFLGGLHSRRPSLAPGVVDDVTEASEFRVRNRC